MKLVMGMLSLLLHQRSIDQTHLKETLIGTTPISFNTYFYGSDHVIYLDKIVLKPKADQSGQWSVDSEIILEKNATQNMSQKALFDFTSAKVFIDRQQLDNLQLSLLAEDDSLMRTVFASNEYTTQPIFDTLMFTNTNVPFINPSESKISQALLRYLDPTIDYLYIENKDNQAFYRLKFNNSEKEITDSNFATIEYYLSSGTVKGITLYQYIVAALRSGGLIFIDELENHFNLAIVRTFMAYFTNPKINPNRAVLIFSTHYADLIDDLSRGDQIFVSRRQDSEIAIDRYSDIADRQDINRAEIFMSNYLGGTAPDYDAYMELRQQTINLNNKADRANSRKTCAVNGE